MWRAEFKLNLLTHNVLWTQLDPTQFIFWYDLNSTYLNSTYLLPKCNPLAPSLFLPNSNTKFASGLPISWQVEEVQMLRDETKATPRSQVRAVICLREFYIFLKSLKQFIFSSKIFNKYFLWAWAIFFSFPPSPMLTPFYFISKMIFKSSLFIFLIYFPSFAFFL
jgi:hypothetical protein